MADIDSLEIKIVSDATQASASLDAFVSSLERMENALGRINGGSLNTLSQGLQNLSNALVGLSNIDGRKFTTIANNVNKLSAIKGADLMQSANGLSAMSSAFGRIGTVAPQSAQSIADLGSSIKVLGSKMVDQAINNMPRLATALSDLFTQLSQVPNVKRNVIALTNALTNFVSSLRGVPKQTLQAGKSLENLQKQSTKSVKTFTNLTSKIGLFYAKFFLVMRGIKKLWSATESAMDYVETYNYFAVALDKLGRTTAKAYGEMGENDAETYTDTFRKKLTELNRKMTGYKLGDNGELIDTESIGLGLNPERLMNFQAQIMGITNSMGMLGDTSTNTAKALSMLASDLSSLTNTDLETVMGNLQSALIGQARAVYRYGIDITNASLAQTALNHGVEKSVKTMSQAEKAQLRLLAILEQSQIAWGDQARTINSVANMYRVFREQVANLGRVIGNLLLPIVKVVLPYLNAIIIVLKRLFTLLGFKLYGNSWLSDLNEDIGSIGGGVGDLEDLGEELEDTADSAKKLKQQLLGLDELNVLTTQEDSGSSKGLNMGGLDLGADIADALADYEAVWDRAFANAKNKAEEIADYIWGMLERFSKSKFWQAVKELFDVLKKIAGISFKTIIDFWKEFLAPVASWLGNEVFAKLVRLFHEFVDKINWDKILSALRNLYKVLAKFTINIGKGIIAVFEPLTKLALNVLAGIINALATAIDFLAQALLKIPENVLVAIGGFIGAILAKSLITSAWQMIKALPLLSSAIVGVKEAFMVLQAYGLKPFISYLGTFLNPITLAIGIMGALVAVTTVLNEKWTDSANAVAISALSFENLTKNCQDGVFSLEELNTSFINTTKSISGEWVALNEKITPLEGLKTEVRNAVTEINKISRSINLGAYTAEQKIPDLISQFESLYSQTKTLMQEEYDVIIMGLSGALSDVLIANGENIPDLIAQYALVQAKGEEIVADVYKEYAEAKAKFEKDNDAEAFAQTVYDLAQKLDTSGLSKALDTSTRAMEDFAGALNIEDYLTDNGLALDKFEQDIKAVSSAYTEGLTSIEEASTKYEDTLKAWETEMQNLGIDTASTKVSDVLDANEQATVDATTKQKQALQEYIGALDEGLLNQIPSIIQEAKDTYAGSDFLQDMFSEDAYTKKALDEWIANTVTPLYDTLGSEFEEFGTEGSEMATQAMQEIVDSLFDVEKIYGGQGQELFHIATLKADWEEEFKREFSTIDSYGTLYNVMKLGGEGFNNAIDDNVDESEKKTKNWFLSVLSTAVNILRIHSPSREFYEYGGYVVEGFNNGVSDGIDSSITVMNEWGNAILDSFDSISTDACKEGIFIGTCISQGIIDGMNSLKYDIKSTAQELADLVKLGIEKALDIHSPSRVMFGLGQYTTEGFKLGMESLYSETERSLQGFAGDLASVPQTDYSYNANNYNANSSGLSESLYPAIYDAMSSALADNNGSVNVTLEGDANRLFRVVQEKSNNFKKRTGQNAFA